MGRGREASNGQVIKDYLGKSHFKDLTSTQLAKIIFNENPGLWESTESVRAAIRYYRGKSGDANRLQMADKRFVRNELVLSRHNSHELPESDAMMYEPMVMPTANDHVLILADMHIPYHDVDAINEAINWTKERKINTVVLAGDIIDCYHLSVFAKDPRKRDFEGERDMFWRVLDILQNKFSSANFYYLEGNHEERWRKSLMTSPGLAKAAYGLNEFELDIILRLGERGITWIGERRKLYIGKLAFIHGHELPGRSGGVNPARSLYLKTGGNAMCGHWHRTSDHSQTNIEEELRGAWSVGCLCELHPHYMPINNWNHGFARVITAPDGTFKVFNPRIYNGKML